MFRACMLIMIVSSPVFGEEILLHGTKWAFPGPHGPYSAGFQLQITLGYGDSNNNTLGQNLWLSGPGDFDLGNDPNYGNFLLSATNGVSDSLTVTLEDQAGYWQAFVFSEISIFNTQGPPDLAGLVFQGIHMNVIELSMPSGGSVVQWNVIAAPEPSVPVGLLIALTIGGSLSKRQRLARWKHCE